MTNSFPKPYWCLYSILPNYWTGNAYVNAEFTHTFFQFVYFTPNNFSQGESKRSKKSKKRRNEGTTDYIC